MDDTGFGHLSSFGGLVETPNMDKLAGDGLRYNNFHTTALADNEFQRLASTTNCIYRNALIQRGEFAFIANSQAQEIDVCDLSMGNYRISFEDFQDTQIFRPKMVTCCFAKLAQD